MSFKDGLALVGEKSPPKFTRVREPTLLWNHFTSEGLGGHLLAELAEL